MSLNVETYTGLFGTGNKDFEEKFKNTTVMLTNGASKGMSSGGSESNAGVTNLDLNVFAHYGQYMNDTVTNETGFTDTKSKKRTIDPSKFSLVYDPKQRINTPSVKFDKKIDDIINDVQQQLRIPNESPLQNEFGKGHPAGTVFKALSVTLLLALQ
jgi:hypothetical protein